MDRKTNKKRPAERPVQHLTTKLGLVQVRGTDGRIYQTMFDFAKAGRKKTR